MKRSPLYRLLSLLLSVALGFAPLRAMADDIDIFVGGGGTAAGPKILIVLDNTSNWSKQSQKWPGGLAQGQSEVQAIQTVLTGLNANVNLGLMEFVTGGTANDDGGFIRQAIQPMSAANQSVFSNSLTTINNNITSPNEKRNSGTAYGDLMYDVYNYYSGLNSYSPNAVISSLADANGYTSLYSKFHSPLSDANACGRNFVIFISNPDQSGPSADSAANGATLTALGGSVSPEIPYQNYTTTTATSSTVLGYTSACYASQAACTTTDYAANCAVGAGYDSCTCGAPTSTGQVIAPNPSGLYTWTAYGQGTRTVSTNYTGVTTNYYASASAASVGVAGGDTGSLSCPAGSTCTYAVGATSGSGQVGTPVSSSGTTNSCYASAPSTTALASDGGLSCPSGSTCTYTAGAQGSLCPSSPTTTSGTTAACYGSTPTSAQLASDSALPCPSGSSCSYTAGATSGSSCVTPVTSTGVTNSCYASTPSSTTLATDHGSLSCPSGSTCSYAAGATSGSTCSPSTTSTATTSSCYASPSAAQTAIVGGDTGGLSCPAGDSCSYSVGAQGSLCNPSTNNLVTTNTCYASNSPPTSSNIVPDSGISCPAGSTCSYTGISKGSNSGCGGGTFHFTATQTVTPTPNYHYGLTQTATPSPLTYHYSVTQSALAPATYAYSFTRSATPSVSTYKFAFSQTATPVTKYQYAITQTVSTTTAAVAAPGAVIGTTTGQYSTNTGITEFATQCSQYSGGCIFGNPNSTYLAPACSSGAHYSVLGNINSIVLTPTGTSSIPTDGANADEWARFLHQNVILNSANSTDTIKQSITTYTIDVYNAQPNADTTSLLQSMAKVGGGKYFQASSQAAIVAALQSILTEIQSVNSTFASASLPVNATNRTQNANQVFIGMFRPDPNANPRWFGNLKQYAIGTVNGQLDLVDQNSNPATNNLTGFVDDCAASFWTTDSPVSGVPYWSSLATAINPDPASKCASVTTSQIYSDYPDGPTVEKGAVAEVLRRGNNPGSAATWTFNRNVLTGASNPLTTFSTTSTLLSSSLVNFTLGEDVNNDTGRGGPTTTVTRPSIHGDVIHSRPLPVNYGAAGVTVYYGANDGSLRAVDASSTGLGKERWAYIPPEFYNDTGTRLLRLQNNTPAISYPPTPALGSMRKNYFFDGSIGIYQKADNSKVWIYPSERRGGRMVYGLDVTNPANNPALLWRNGCPDLGDDTGCTSGYSQIGQTWSTPNVAYINGYSTAGILPVVAMGGGYDGCEDAETATPSCGSAKGNVIYFIDATDGHVIRSFTTDRSVAADVTLVDVNNDGLVDYAYAADTGGNVYRVDFVNGPGTLTPVASSSWVMHKVAYTNGAGRKFLFAPGLFVSGSSAYVALVSGDREHPLITDYPYTTPVVNRAYVYKDDLTSTASTPAVSLDDPTVMLDYTNPAISTCTSGSLLSLSNVSMKGWFMNLTANGTGEQGVTSALIVGGMVTFSTNMPVASNLSCGTVLGNAYGYFVNLFNGSGSIGTANNASCGGSRSSQFAGGGLPPSPVIGIVPINGVPTAVLIGAPDRSGGTSSPIRPTHIVPPIVQSRTRTYNYIKQDNN